MSALLASPVFSVAATVGLFYLAQLLYLRTRSFLLNPVLLTVAALIALLHVAGIDYDTYNQGGRIISFFLGPSVVALGVLLHEQMPAVKARAAIIVPAIIVASLTGIASVVLIASALGANDSIVSSLAPKSVTTPIAMGIAEKTGGMAPLTAAIVVGVGILGAVFGPGFLRLIGVRDSAASGLALGAASHGIGTARAIEQGPLQGASGGLAICLNGIATALLSPPLLKLMRWLLAE